METTTDQPAILDNLATVLQYTEQEPGGNGWRRHGVAICHRNQDLHPFVVWTVIQNDDGTWFAEQGNYCENLQQAVEHYERRGGR